MVVEQTPTVVTFLRAPYLLSLNDRLHWREARKRAKAWRTRSAEAAREQVGHELGPCIVAVTLPALHRIARDPHNYFATVKPIVDGLVDAGLWPDDTPTWVTTVEPTLVPVGRAAWPTACATVTLTPRTER